MKNTLTSIVQGDRLPSFQAARAMRQIMRGEASDAQVAGLLMGMAVRGETLEELTAFTKVMREFLVPVRCEDAQAIDLCGTGGDGLGTFNISTTTSFVCAGAGVTVAKHGNVGVSSKCGSADVLKELGIHIDLGPDGVATCLDEVGIGFIFARHYHPAMKHVMPARRQLAVRTCFNILGPLCNPAGVRRQVVGAFNSETATKMARILQNLGAAHVVTVSAPNGMDEFSLEGPIPFSEFKHTWPELREREVSPEKLGLLRTPVESLVGGDTKANAELLLDVLRGEPGPRRDVVLLNSAFGIRVSGQHNGLYDCLDAAKESIDSGKALAKLEALRTTSQKLQ